MAAAASSSSYKARPVFNETYDGFRPASTSSFPRFPDLPAELRLKVWEAALQRSRIITIRAWAGWRPSWEKQPERYSTRNELGHVVSGNMYSLYADSLPRPALLRVNRESRDAALVFYRVRLPFFREDQHGSGGLLREPEAARVWPLYLNPEHDFLDTDVADVQHLVDLLHDVKAFDPRGAGALNLMLYYREARPVTYVLNKLTTAARESLAATLAGLRSLWLKLPVDHRIMPACGRARPWGYFNHSLPIKADASGFERLARDPRPIDGDLAHVPCPPSPAAHLRRWARLEAYLGIARRDPLDVRFVVAADLACHSRREIDRRLQRALLRHEDMFVSGEVTSEDEACSLEDRDVLVRRRRAKRNIKTWKDFVDKPRAGGAGDGDGSDGSDGGDQREEEDIPTVFGFWLFPSSIFDRTSAAEGPPVQYQTARGFGHTEEYTIADLSAQRPELCVLDLV
ncbi:uncharacterized protein JN550_010752 [Neoarthrinium moseri]|uniref:uncharacterized protein n=1 Tax=Neoarthrinium moseri TaxID=1658444 RepID=UPI001FDCE2C4|nr:uncharacterized protein JN550_010752 [Neoarthrinium moseri]KAI1861682.1 hypothetical protein JN550_010752 [Neoarthrinium moseri]